MPAIPTFTLTPSDTLGRIRVTVTNSDTPDFNEVYRNESGQAPVRIAGAVAVDGTFDDYAIPSGIAQFYSVRAVDGVDVADSIIQNSSITLKNLWLHAVQKDAASNLFGTAYELKGMVPHTRSSDRATEILISPARPRAIMATGEVVNRQWATSVLSSDFSRADVLAVKALQALRRALCMRDGRGNILFGTIASLSIQYDVNSLVSFTLAETDFNQQVA